MAFLVDLFTHADVEPFLSAVSAKSAAELLEQVRCSEDDPDAYGVFVIEVDGARAGTVRFSRANARSRIADLGGLAIHPDYRGRHVGADAARLFRRHLLDDLGYHRLQLEVYGFNDRALAHAERAGFVREGVRRKAYWRHGEWVDSVLYGLVAEDVSDDS